MPFPPGERPAFTALIFFGLCAGRSSTRLDPTPASSRSLPRLTDGRCAGGSDEGLLRNVCNTPHLHERGCAEVKLRRLLIQREVVRRALDGFSRPISPSSGARRREPVGRQFAPGHQVLVNAQGRERLQGRPEGALQGGMLAAPGAGRGLDFGQRLEGKTPTTRLGLTLNRR